MLIDRAPLTQDEVVEFQNGTLELDQDLYERLYAHYTHPSRGTEGMPYGTAKARSGDPQEWIYNQLEREFGN